MDILMEEQMNYISMPSLQQRALIKTVIAVWNQDDVRAFTAETMESMIFMGRGEKWQVVEDKVIEKVQVLPLPESLKMRLINIVKPILLQVYHWWWLLIHDYLCDQAIVTQSLNKICWTPQGTIDRKKTAEAIIRDEKLSIKERYVIACAYCLKNDILMLWNKIPENQRKRFYSEEAVEEQHPVVLLWTYDVKGEMNRMENFTRANYRITPYQYALEEAVLENNQVATEYILQKLTTEERQKCLVGSAEYFCMCTIESDFSLDVDVLWFLLSQMNEEQKIEVLENCSGEMLSCLLLWPWQGLFMKMAKHVWPFLRDYQFSRLLKLIINKVEDGFKDYDYQYLFREFWQQSPITLKEHNIVSFILFQLLQIKDKGNIKLILKDLTTLDREKEIFYICEALVRDDEIDSFEFFVQECLSTKDITIKLRESIKQKNSMMWSRWSKFSQLLDGITQNCDNKRCVEDGNSGPSKRFCS